MCLWFERGGGGRLLCFYTSTNFLYNIGALQYERHTMHLTVLGSRHEWQAMPPQSVRKDFPSITEWLEAHCSKRGLASLLKQLVWSSHQTRPAPRPARVSYSGPNLDLCCPLSPRDSQIYPPSLGFMQPATRIWTSSHIIRQVLPPLFQT